MGHIGRTVLLVAGPEMAALPSPSPLDRATFGHRFPSRLCLEVRVGRRGHSDLDSLRVILDAVPRPRRVCVANDSKRLIISASAGPCTKRGVRGATETNPDGRQHGLGAWATQSSDVRRPPQRRIEPDIDDT
jgi:hypothetical protein